MQIQDGTGKGYLVKVDESNRLRTYATSVTESHFVSHDYERAYSISTENQTFNSTNEHPILYLRNNNPNLTIILSSVIYSYNGGDTNHDRTMVKRVYRNVDAPTANFSSLAPQNLNFGSLRSAVVDSYMWDDSASDGMTIDTSGINNLSTSTVPKGNLVLEEIGSVVIPYNASVLWTFQPEEVGKFSISLKFYFEDI